MSTAGVTTSLSQMSLAQPSMKRIRAAITTADVVIESDEERSPSVMRSFYWDVAYFVELDELILVVCFVFPHRVLIDRNQSILLLNYFTILHRIERIYRYF
jgi:hypothetical protein